MGKVCVLFALLACAGATPDFDESFTIFIDLDDFHVTQADNPNFLHHSAIGPHDNVILHLTEDEMKHHMDKHETHDCHHPSELHEVVSFIQEAMYETPSTPDFIDDAIQSNYIQDGAWEKAKVAQAPQSAFGMMQQPAFNSMMPQQMMFPFGGTGMSMFNKPGPKPVEHKAPIAAAPVAAAPAAAPAAEAAPAAAKTESAADEEEAVARFRDAYHAYKSFNQAFNGVGSSPSSPPAMPPLNSLLDSIIDDEDRQLLGAFSPSAFSPSAFSPSASRMVPTPNLDDTISQAMDKAYRDILGQALPNAHFEQPPVARQVYHAPPPAHHHHHHHHAPAAAVVQPAPVAAAPPSGSLASLSEQEVETLEHLLSKVTHEVPAVSPPMVDAAPAAAAPRVVPTAAAVGASRPAAPVMTSHIEKAPAASDFVPESVYAQESVSFADKPQEIVKHVPKRILIPRMEEPGPVIGGGSRPMHIQIPKDMEAMPSAPAPAAAPTSGTRPVAPSAPSTLTIAIQSESSITNAQPAGTESVKPSTLAAIGDEALTAPEVVIF